MTPAAATLQGAIALLPDRQSSPVEPAEEMGFKDSDSSASSSEEPEVEVVEGAHAEQPPPADDRGTCCAICTKWSSEAFVCSK